MLYDQDVSRKDEYLFSPFTDYLGTNFESYIQFNDDADKKTIVDKAQNIVIDRYAFIRHRLLNSK
jgi:hypothetical protein